MHNENIMQKRLAFSIKAKDLTTLRSDASIASSSNQIEVSLKCFISWVVDCLPFHPSIYVTFSDEFEVLCDVLCDPVLIMIRL